MFDIKQKATNKFKNKQKSLLHTDNRLVVARGYGGEERTKRVKRVKYTRKEMRLQVALGACFLLN